MGVEEYWAHQQVVSKIDEMPARAAAAVGEDDRCAFLQDGDCAAAKLRRQDVAREQQDGDERVLQDEGRDDDHDDGGDDDDDDAIELILWYRNTQSIYSVDARARQPSPVYAADMHPPGANPASQAANGQSLVPVSPSAATQLDLLAELGAEQLQLNYSKGYNNGTSTAETNTGAPRTKHKQQQQQQKHLRGLFGANLMERKASRHYALGSMSSRMRFGIHNASAYLIIDKLRPSDSGQYKCRVDFRQARTRYQTSLLEVISKS